MIERKVHGHVGRRTVVYGLKAEPAEHALIGDPHRHRPTNTTATSIRAMISGSAPIVLVHIPRHDPYPSTGGY
jgi:hypothetical protein